MNIEKRESDGEEMIEHIGLSLGVTLLATLVLIAFISGIGMTTIGPGGIFLTIGLYVLTPLASSTIAGTVQIAFIATSLIGSAAYIKSGEISGEYLILTVILSGGSIAGALFGAWLNGFVSRALFGFLLGGLAGGIGLLIIYRERKSLGTVQSIDPATTEGKVGYALLGFVLGTCSGLLGVGGPVLAVPVLVLIGLPMLYAVAIAQVQAVCITTFAATGYLLQGTVSLTLAAVVGIPLVAGVVVGWGVAHRVNPDRLKATLGVILVLIAPYLVI